MTIKLSLFMLDPVAAHAKYIKEIDELKKKIEVTQKLADDVIKEKKALYKTMKEKVRQMGKQIGSMEKK
jgi:hypothetical protein